MTDKIGSSSGFDGFQFMDAFISRMEQATEAAGRLADALTTAQAKDDKDEKKSLGGLVKSIFVEQLIKRTGLEEIHASGKGGEVLSKLFKGFKSNGLNKLGALFGKCEGAMATAEAGAAGEAGASIAGMGMAAELGPVGIAVLALTETFDKVKEAAMELWEAASDAARALAEVATSRFVSGGTPQEQAKLNAVGSALGMSPEEVSHAARQFGEQVTSDPKKRAFASRSGMNVVGGPFGDTDHAKRFLKATEFIRRLSPGEAEKWATSTGFDPAIAGGIRANSPQTWERLMKSVPAKSPAEEKMGIEFMTEMQIVKNNLGEIVHTITSKTLPPLLFGMKLLNKFLGGLQRQVQIVVDYLMNVPFVKNLVDRLTGEPGEKRQTAVEKNTEAVQKLTDAMEDNVYGDAAAAARRAVPKGMEAWQIYDRQAYSHRLSLGGIAL